MSAAAIFTGNGNDDIFVFFCFCDFFISGRGNPFVEKPVIRTYEMNYRTYYQSCNNSTFAYTIYAGHEYQRQEAGNSYQCDIKSKFYVSELATETACNNLYEIFSSHHCRIGFYFKSYTYSQYHTTYQQCYNHAWICCRIEPEQYIVHTYIYEYSETE